MQIPSNSNGLGSYQLKQESSLAVMDKAMSQMDVKGNGLIHMMNNSTSKPVEEGHPTLGNVIDTKA